MKRPRTPSLLLVICASVTCLSFNIHAAAITYSFEGSVTEFADAANAFAGVSASSPVKVAFTFDLATPDSAPGEPYYNTYSNGISSLSLAVGSYTLTQPNLSWGNVLFVEDNHPVYKQDSFVVSYVLTSPAYPELNVDIRLIASPPKNPFSTALPPSAIDLSQFNVASIWLRDSFFASGSPLDIKAAMTSVSVSTSVADSGSTLSFLALCLIGLAFWSGRGAGARSRAETEPSR